MVDALFEKLVPEEKRKMIPTEKRATESGPTRTSDREDLEKEVSQIKEFMSDIGKELGEMQAQINKVEKKTKGIEDYSSLAQNLGDKYTLIKKLDNVENFLQEFQSKLDTVEKTREQVLQDFQDKLLHIDDAKRKILHQGSRVNDMYNEIRAKLDGLDRLLDKMQRFDKIFTLAERLEHFDVDMKRKVENNMSTWNFPIETIDQMRASILEENFYASLALLPMIKKKSVLMVVLERINKLIDEMKRKNLWNLDKKYLLEEILKEQNIQDLSLV